MSRTTDEELDDAPLEPDEAASGAARAGEPVASTLEELVASTAAALGDAQRRPAATGGEELARLGSLFAALGPDGLDVRLEGPVARAALATPDTAPSPRGAGWVRFDPRVIDRFAADRVEAWLAFAWRRAGEGTRH